MSNSAQASVSATLKAVPKPLNPNRSPGNSIEKLLSDEHARTSAVRSTLLPEDFPLTTLAEHPLNILTLEASDRAQLLAGPKISLIGDGNAIIRKGVPARALMASCTKVHDLVHIKPHITRFNIQGKIDRKSINILLDEFTTERMVQADKITLTSGDIVKDVSMYQACLSLGIHYVHTNPLLNALRAEITARLLTTDELNMIANRFPKSDPLFKHLANTLCHRRFKKEIPDVLAFEKWLGNKKALQRAMMEIDQAHKKRREAINARKSSCGSDTELKK